MLYHNTVDHEDAPIFAAAVIAQPDIVISSAFETFHAPKAKRYWKKIRHSDRKPLWTPLRLCTAETKAFSTELIDPIER